MSQRPVKEVVQHLADRNIFILAGSFYAREIAYRLETQQHGVVCFGLPRWIG